MDDFFGLGKMSSNSLEVAKMVYPDLLQPAAKKAGMALATVFDLANTILLPIKLLNDPTQLKARKWMELYAKQLDKHPEENIGSVTPEIGLPILDQLLIVTNDEIAGMYTNLLVNASLIDRSRYAHPGFVNILKNISIDEARIIEHFRQGNDPIIAVSFVKESSSNEAVFMAGEIFLNLHESINLLYDDNADLYFQNLLKLGILDREMEYPSWMKSVYDRNVDKIAQERARLKYQIIIEGDKDIHLSSDEITLHYLPSKYGREFIRSIS